MFALKNFRSVYKIPTEMVHAGEAQPRQSFDEDELSALAQSVTQHGIIQPISVTIDDRGGYSVVAGERRLRAAIMAGLTHVPCIIIQARAEEAAVLSLVENLQRSDLDIFEEAQGISRLISYYHLTQEEAAKKLGKTQSAIANKLRLLTLTADQMEIIRNAGLTERHARALLSLPEEKRDEVLKQIVAKGLNVAQTDALVKSINENVQSPKRRIPPLFKDVRIFANTINHAVTVMKNSGINATCSRRDYEDRLEYNIVIPK